MLAALGLLACCCTSCFTYRKCTAWAEAKKADSAAIVKFHDVSKEQATADDADDEAEIDPAALAVAVEAVKAKLGAEVVEPALDGGAAIKAAMAHLGMAPCPRLQTNIQAVCTRLEIETGWGAKGMFKKFDADDSGSLERAEIKELCKEMGLKLTKKGLDGAMADMDADGSGGVNFDEFNKWWKKNAGAKALKNYPPESAEEKQNSAPAAAPAPAALTGTLQQEQTILHTKKKMAEERAARRAQLKLYEATAKWGGLYPKGVEFQQQDFLQPPTAAEVAAFGREVLGLDVDGDELEFLYLAEAALVAPLPLGWGQGEDGDGNTLFLKLGSAGEVWSHEHPFTPHFRRLVDKQRGIKAEREARASRGGPAVGALAVSPTGSPTGSPTAPLLLEDGGPDSPALPSLSLEDAPGRVPGIPADLVPVPEVEPDSYADFFRTD